MNGLNMKAPLEVISTVKLIALPAVASSQDGKEARTKRMVIQAAGGKRKGLGRYIPETNPRPGGGMLPGYEEPVKRAGSKRIEEQRSCRAKADLVPDERRNPCDGIGFRAKLEERKITRRLGSAKEWGPSEPGRLGDPKM
jgi:hypothetical protein